MHVFQPFVNYDLAGKLNEMDPERKVNYGLVQEF
jgi:hypothetical protein